MRNEQRHLAGTVFVLAAITLTSRVLGFVREQILAGTLGATYAADAFVAAQLVPTALDAMVGTAMATALLPLLAAARAKGEEELGRLYRAAALALGAGYALEAALLFAAAPWVMRMVAPGLPPEAQAQAVALARTLAPAPLLLGLASLHQALLHTHGRFWLPAVAALGPNLAVLAAFALLHRHMAAEHIATALAVGYAVQMAPVVAAAWRLGATRGRGADWGAVGRAVALAAPLMASSALGNATTFFDKFLASHMGEGVIAALNYALKLVQLPVGVVMQGLSQVLYARFAQQAAAGDRSALAADVGRALRLLLFLFLPAAGLLAALAHPAVAVAFQRGRFDAEATALTAQAMAAYAAGVLPMGALPVLAGVANALQRTGLPLLAGAAGTAAYVAAALALGPLLAHRGLALAWALAQGANVAVLAWAAWRHLGAGALRPAAAALPANLAAAGAATVAAWAVRAALAHPLLQLGLGGAAGAVAWLAVHGALRTPELGWLWGVARSGWARVRARWMGAGGG